MSAFKSTRHPHHSAGGRRSARAVLSAALFLGVCAIATPMSHAQPAASRDWLDVQRNAQHKGRADGVGAIDAPSILWESRAGGQVNDRAVLLEDINDDDELDVVVVVGGAVVARRLDETLLWDTPPLGLNSLAAVEDFDGDGRREVLALGRIAILLDGATGRELWRYEDPGGQPLASTSALVTQADDDPALEIVLAIVRPTRLIMHDFSQGFNAQTRRWTLEDPAVPTNVLRPVLGDVRGGGAPDSLLIVNQDHCRVLQVSLSTGALEDLSEPLSQGRFCYGLTQAADVDLDGDDELIFTGAVGNSRGSVSVTVYDPLARTVQWQYEYATNDPVTTTLTPAGAVADLDGDGRLELAISVFNNTEEIGDAQDTILRPERWSVALYDAATGAPLGALDDLVAIGVTSPDSQGARTLLTRRALPNSVRIPELGGVVGVSLDEQRRATVLWSLDDVQPVTQIQRDPHISSRDSGVTPASLDTPTGSQLLLLAQDGGGERRLETWRGDTRPPTRSGSRAEPGGIKLTHLPTGDRATVALKNNQGLISLLRPDLTLQAEVSFTGHVTPALIAPLQRQSFELITRDSAGDLVVRLPATATRADPPQERWRVAAPFNVGELMAMDPDGDGVYGVAQAGALGDGTPFIEFIDGDGERQWRTLLPEASRLPNALTPGRFGPEGSGTHLAALLITLEGQARTLLLDGASGRILAMRDADLDAIQANPNRDLLPLGDLNGDGRDDLALLHYTTMERLSGEDLSPIGSVIPYPAQSSRPARNPLLSRTNGSPAIFLNLFSTRKALLDLESGEQVWDIASEPSFTRAQAQYPGLADVDGDGLNDVALPGNFGDLTVLSGRDGAVLRRQCLADGAPRSLDEPATAESCSGTTALSAIAVADINGDEVPEHLVGLSDGWLYALRVDTGEPIWSIFFKASVSSPIVADLDDDDRLEVLVATADSRLIAIDDATIEAPTEAREVLLDDTNTPLAVDEDIDLWGRRDALGAAWDPVEGADGYLVTLLSENLNPVSPPRTVDAHNAVFEGLSLVNGATYTVQVVAFNAAAGASSPTRSDGVLITGRGPVIRDFRASPDPFDPLEGESQRFEAQLAAAAGLDAVTLNVKPLADPFSAPVLTLSRALEGAELATLDELWDGERDGDTLPAGAYEALLVVTDVEGVSAAATLQVSIVERGSQEDVGGTPDGGVGDDDVSSDVQIFVNRNRSGCECTLATRGPQGAAWPWLVLLLAWVVSRRRLRAS